MKNKYNVGDKVQFEITYKGETKMVQGEVFIVDKNGVFGYPNVVSYDIMVDDFFDMGKTLCKHIFEEFVKPTE